MKDSEKGINKKGINNKMNGLRRIMGRVSKIASGKEGLHFMGSFSKIVPVSLMSLIVFGFSGATESRELLEEVTELRSLTVESWDQDYSNQGWGWRLSTDQDDAQEKEGKYNPKKSSVRAYREVKLLEGGKVNYSGEQSNPQAKILGIKFTFNFSGNHLVYLSPPVADRYTSEKYLGYIDEAALLVGVKRPSCFQDKNRSFDAEGGSQAIQCIRGVRLPGQVQHLMIWVLSRNYDYTLEALLENSQGKTASVKFGDLDFLGWRQLAVRIPKNLEQESTDAALGGAGLILKRLQLRRKPYAKSGKVHLFFDDLKILTNIKRKGYPGRSVVFDKADCEELNKENELIGGSKENSGAWSKIDCSKVR